MACVDGHVVALARHPAATSQAPGWWHELPPGQHPTQAVVEALTRELHGMFDQSTSVVHSTSWRYESEHLVLSYLAVLQPLMPLASAPPGFVLQPVPTRPAGAGRTSDTSAIPVLDVLAHGLRHLAMLRVSDPTIANTLSGCWHELLAGWNPLPAGLLDHCVPAPDATVSRPHLQPPPITTRSCEDAQPGGQRVQREVGDDGDTEHAQQPPPPAPQPGETALVAPPQR
ncbi:MAG: hypothetical protein ACRDSL_16455 [Pseudonocardiaceae bacterium]